MQPRKILKTFLFFLSIVGFCFGQEIVEDENWLKGFGTEADYLPSLIYPFTNFTKEDLSKGKQRLKIVRLSASKNEWEGTYYSNTEIGDSKLIWNSEGGFFDFYFYHYLKRFNYGTVNNSLSVVELVSEKPLITASRKNQLTRTRLIKVKVGEKHFLIPENRLLDFCERVVGRSTDLQDFSYYKMKQEDMEKKVFGLPRLPSEYKHFLRYPIEAKINNVGKKKIIPNEQSTAEFNFNNIHYPVTLNAGKNKKIKIKMNFFVEELGEWIEITKILQTKSIGIIRRGFDENKKEQCFDNEGGSGQIVPCKEIRVGMKSKTKIIGMQF